MGIFLFFVFFFWGNTCALELIASSYIHNCYSFTQRSKNLSFRPPCSLMECYVERSPGASFLHSMFVVVLMDLREVMLLPSHWPRSKPRTQQDLVLRGGRVFSLQSKWFKTPHLPWSLWNLLLVCLSSLWLCFLGFSLKTEITLFRIFYIFIWLS